MLKLLCVLFTALFATTCTPVSAPIETNEDVRALPIIMYHKVLKSKTGKYTVTPSQLDADFAAFKNAGFTAVHMREVIDWVNGRGELPAKPIVITFDDGYFNNVHYGLDIAKKHNTKFGIYPVTSFSKYSTESGDSANPNYSHLTWREMSDAFATGMVEFGNHTHRMHRFRPRYGIMPVGTESTNEYHENLRADIKAANDLIESAGVPRPTTFAYPFGKYSAESRELLIDMGFDALLTCNEKVNKIRRGDPTCLHSLGRFNRDGNYSTETILKKIS